MKRVAKWLGGILAAYVVFVFLFEAVYLGMLQPSFEEQGIPMLVLITQDDEGNSHERMLANFELGGKNYVSAHHWPRSWYQRAIDQGRVQVEIDGVRADYEALPVEGEEFDQVAAAYQLPFFVRFMMGFPPSRDIARLDPVSS